MKHRKGDDYKLKSKMRKIHLEIHIYLKQVVIYPATLIM